MKNLEEEQKELIERQRELIKEDEETIKDNERELMKLKNINRFLDVSGRAEKFNI